MLSRSVEDSEFMHLFREWLKASGEGFVVVRYSHSAGARDYFLIDSFARFEDVISRLPAMADVIAFRQRQLPIRGIAGERLLEQAMAEIPEGGEFLFLNLEPSSLQTLYASGGESHAELAATLKEFAGKYVAVGRYPRWYEDDNEDMQSGVVPSADGTVKRGVY